MNNSVCCVARLSFRQQCTQSQVLKYLQANFTFPKGQGDPKKVKVL